MAVRVRWCGLAPRPGVLLCAGVAGGDAGGDESKSASSAGGGELSSKRDSFLREGLRSGTPSLLMDGYTYVIRTNS